MNAPMMFIASILILLGLVLLMDRIQKVKKNRKQINFKETIDHNTIVYNFHNELMDELHWRGELRRLKQQLHQRLELGWEMDRISMGLLLRINKWDYETYYKEYDIAYNKYMEARKKVDAKTIEDIKNNNLK
jgi:hypothetical protein